MKIRLHPRWPAYLCSAILLLCALAAHPMAETGMNGDFSYVMSAQALAQTGRDCLRRQTVNIDIVRTGTA